MVGRFTYLALAVLTACTVDKATFMTADGGPDDDDIDAGDDGPVQRILASTSSIEVLEGDDGNVQVQLAIAPEGEITVDVTTNDTAIATASPATLTFTPDNYAIDQSVTITGVEDTDGLPAGTALLFTSGGAERPSNVAIGVTDNDVQGILLDTTAVELAEGGATTFGVRLVLEPASDVTVAVASNDTGAATVAQPSLTFTMANWDTYQFVTVNSPVDGDAHFDATTVSATSSGLTSRAVDVTVVEPTGINISGPQYVCQGTQEFFSVTLDGSPLTSRQFYASSEDQGYAYAGGTMTFNQSNYSTIQTFYVYGHTPTPGGTDATIAVKLDGGNLMTASIEVAVQASGGCIPP